MNLIEITETIHGEAPFQGSPCLLVRLAGCNISCPYCDTNSDEKFKMSIDKLIQVLEGTKLKDVLITGGEPLLQSEEVISLIEQCTKRYVIETNGSIIIPDMPLGRQVTIVLDCKLHDNLEHFNILNLKRINSGDIVKFVFWDSQSFELGRDVILGNHMDVAQGVKWVFSPTYNLIAKGKLKQYVEDVIDLQKKLKHTETYFQVQIHKLLGVK